MLNLLGERHSVLALLLYIFALFTITNCEKIQPAFPPSSAPLKDLEARTGSSASTSSENVGIPGVVLSLWRDAAKKVPVNNKFVETTLDPSKNTVITTGTCYGCTAVALCSGSTCVMAHFKEENGAVKPWLTGAAADESFEANVEGPIEDAMSTYKNKLGSNPFAVVFTPNTAPARSSIRHASKGRAASTIPSRRSSPRPLS